MQIYFLFTQPLCLLSCKTVASFGEIQPRANRSMLERTFNLDKKVLGIIYIYALRTSELCSAENHVERKKIGTLLNVARCIGVIRFRCWAFPAFHFSVKQRKARNKT